MGSMLLAVVPSKSSKKTSRIPNPFPLRRHAISTLTPSMCSPIKKKENGKVFSTLSVLLRADSQSTMDARTQPAGLGVKDSQSVE